MEEVETIQLDAETAPNVFKPGQFITIKAEMLAGDWAAIQNKAAKVAQTGKTGGATMDMQLGEIMLMTLQRMIVDWHGMTRKVRHHDGTFKEVPLSFSPENVRFLKRRYFTYVYETMNTLYEDESGEEQQSFLTGANGHMIADSETANHALKS